MTNAETSLLQRVAEGDTSAVEKVVDTYGGLIWSLASQFTQTDADAEEAVQEVFLLLWRKAAQFSPDRGTEATFVSVLTRRLLIDRWRRASRQPTIEARAEPGTSNAATGHVEFGEMADAALEVFATLDEQQQTALRLSIEKGMTHNEIATATDTPLGTVKSRIRSGLRAIRNRLSIVNETDERTAAAPTAEKGGRP